MRTPPAQQACEQHKSGRSKVQESPVRVHTGGGGVVHDVVVVTVLMTCSELISIRLRNCTTLENATLTGAGAVDTLVVVVFGLMLKQAHPEDSCEAANMDRAGILMRLSRTTSRFSGSGTMALPFFALRATTTFSARLALALGHAALVTTCVAVDV